MSVIHYEKAGGEPGRLEREDYHAENKPFLTAFNYNTKSGVQDKIQIPIERIVAIEE